MFNFLGTLTESQKNDFISFINSYIQNLQDYKNFYKIRATQLRRSSSVLQEHLKSIDSSITPTFNKALFEEPQGGQQFVQDVDDRWPAKIVSEIKNNLIDIFKDRDDLIFQLNNVKLMIEKNEDKAQFYDDADTKLNTLIAELEKLFNDPYYDQALISDSNSTRFRVNSLQDKTDFEKSIAPNLVK